MNREVVRRSCLLAISIMCGSSVSEAQSSIPHPSDEYIESVRPSFVVSKSGQPGASEELQQLALRMRSARRVDSIGTLDGPLETVFGTIADVAVTPSGRIFVLDIANQLVRGFDANRAPSMQLGRRGSGPSDLRTPLALWPDGESTIVVVDAVLGLKYFSTIPGGNAPARVIRIPMSATSACELGGEIFAMAPGSPANTSEEAIDVEPVVKVVDESGRLLRAFGESYRSSKPLIRRVMSEGVLGCSASGFVVLALSKAPFVRGFDTLGRSTWTTKLGDFLVGHSIEELNERGQLTIGLAEDFAGTSFIRKITPISDEVVAVQVGFITPRSLRDHSLWSRIDTYLIDARSGEGVFASSTLPLISAVREDVLVGFENDPFPRVVLLRFD